MDSMWVFGMIMGKRSQNKSGIKMTLIICKKIMILRFCLFDEFKGITFQYHSNSSLINFPLFAIKTISFQLSLFISMAHAQLKEGSVLTFQVLQNTVTYQVRVANTAKGLWLCIEDSGLAWKLTISAEMVEQTVSKASGGTEKLNLKDFTTFLLQALARASEKWSVGIMTPIQLQVLRGGQPSKQASNHKIYLILSDKQKKFHYPFTFAMGEIGEKEKLLEAIRSMKSQLQELRIERSDKSQSSFSILNETLGQAEQLRMENEDIKRKIKIYEQSLTQKRGAVEIDIILKEKNNLELQAETKKREQAKEIARYKNMYQMIEREIGEVRAEVDLINREIALLEDSVGNSNKLKSHALKVLKSYENQLRTQKKVLQKQVKEIENFKRNILTSKNNERKVQAKIKQVQVEIDQSKKKANIKEISNRLHSFKGKGSSVDTPSSKSQSIASSTGKPHSQASSGAGNRVGNLVRDNLVRKNAPASSSGRNNNLLKTSPNINLTANRVSAEKGQPRAVNSSHQNVQKNNYTNPRLFNTQKYRSGSKSQNENDSVRSDSGEKKEVTRQDRQRQRKAMERLTGPRTNPPSVPVPRAPSQERLFKKPQSTNPRTSSQTKPSSVANKASSVKKDSAKEMLAKMKEIKAQYNNRANAPSTNNKNVVNKISETGDKKYQ